MSAPMISAMNTENTSCRNLLPATRARIITIAKAVDAPSKKRLNCSTRIRIVTIAKMTLDNHGRHAAVKTESSRASRLIDMKNRKNFNGHDRILMTPQHAKKWIAQNDEENAEMAKECFCARSCF